MGLQNPHNPFIPGGAGLAGQMSGQLSIDDSRIDTMEERVKLLYSTVDVLEMLLGGKDIVEHRKEYLDQILKLPFVHGNKLKATEVFHRVRKLQEFLEKE